MPDIMKFFIYLLVMAGVTYLVRMIPLVLIKKKVTNRFIKSFLYYVPYSVLAVMTVPAIFSATSYLISAVIGFAVALVLSYMEKSLIVVASSACAAVLVTEIVMRYVVL